VLVAFLRATRVIVYSQPSGYSTTLPSGGDPTATVILGVFSLLWVADISGAAVNPCVRLPISVPRIFYKDLLGR
jgi:hypothetical protein